MLCDAMADDEKLKRVSKKIIKVIIFTEVQLHKKSPHKQMRKLFLLAKYCYLCKPRPLYTSNTQDESTLLPLDYSVHAVRRNGR